MDIRIKIIPHELQRYPTVGDWWFTSKGDLEIRVSGMGNPDYESLVAHHEQIEALLCRKRNISEEDVTKFDIAFEAARQPDNYDEPGNDPAAPYYAEHLFATASERQLAEALGVDWNAYDEAVNSL